MSDDIKTNSPPHPPQKPTKRYLMEVRGVLHVDAPDAAAAQKAVQQWIAAASEIPAALADAEKNEAQASPQIRIGYLRTFPD